MKNWIIISLVVGMLVFTAVPSSVVADTISYDPKIVDIHGHSHPYVEAGGPYQNTSGRTIFFLGYVYPGSSGYPVVYEWKFGDGERYRGNFSSYGKTTGMDGSTFPDVDVYPGKPTYLKCPANHTYTDDGYYAATLTVWDNHGNRAFDTALVCINRDIPDIPDDYPQWKPPSWWQGFCSDNKFSKKVWDTDSGIWAETTSVGLGQSIKFKISFTANRHMTNVEIVDYLPPTVRYKDFSISPVSIEKEVFFDPSGLTFYPFTRITWDIGSVSTGETVVIVINGTVEYLNYSYFGIPEEYEWCPISYQTKNVAVRTYTAYSDGCGNPFTATDKNDASFTIIGEQPSIKLVKKVKNESECIWHDEIDATVGDTIYFKLMINNTGNVDIPTPITVNDHLPTGLEYVKNSASYYICNGSTCTIPIPKEPTGISDLQWVFNAALEENYSIVIIFSANVTEPGNHTNVGEVDAEYNGIPLHSSDSAFVRAEEAPYPAIHLDKKVWNGMAWVDEINATVGEKLAFKIDVANTGSEKLTGINVTDVLPSFLSYVDSSPSPDYVSIDGSTLVWLKDSLNVSESLQIILNATVDDIGSDSNVANVTTDQSVEDEDELPIGVKSIGIEKFVSDDNQNWSKGVNVEVNSTVYFKIVVTNNGSTDLSDVYVNDTLPTFLAYNDDANYTPEETIGNKIVWKFSVLPSNSVIIITFSAKALFTGCAPNCAVVETNGMTDESCAFVYVHQPPVADMLVTKLVSVDNSTWTKYASVHVNDVVYFKIFIHNNGNTNITNLIINDTLPSILSYNSGSAIPSPSQMVGNSIIWNTGAFNLTPGSTLYITFSAKAVNSGTEDNVVNVSAYSEEVQETLYGEDNATISVIPNLPNLTVEKYVKWDCVLPFKKNVTADIGDWVTFKIYVNNTGNVPLNISVKDVLPEGLEFWAGSENHSDVFERSGNALYWNFTNVAEGSSIEIIFRANVTDCGELINFVTATGKFDCMPEIISTDTATVWIPCNPGIDIDKKIWNGTSWVDDLPYEEVNGGSVRFNITVRNTGNLELYNVTVIDILGPCCIYDPSNYSIPPSYVKSKYIYWNFTQLDVGEVIYMEFDAKIDCPAVNSVDVSADYNEGSVSDSDSVTIFRAVPTLSYGPGSHDFGNIEQNETTSTTFEIWNSGNGTLDYTLSESCDWLEVSPTSGTSTGEHDVITVTVNTTGLSSGLHTCDIEIDSNGGNGLFTVTVNVTLPSGPNPILSYSPESHNFGDMEQGQSDSTTFEIWNSGTGILEYELSESCDWVTVSPENGTSTGEHDTITVYIDTSGLAVGYHTCNIDITSDGGSGTFTVSVNVTSPQQPSPVLSFSPTSYDFCDIEQNQTASTTFEIWNSGNGTLDYTLSESCDWLEVSPTSGTSTG
ncbi:MAG: DUF11 domain-containing protein, partial [Thermoplasmata archaeon]|nr:DUF11 domain-containing protein [Thermoplasmata archaeon]